MRGTNKEKMKSKKAVKLDSMDEILKPINAKRYRYSNAQISDQITAEDDDNNHQDRDLNWNKFKMKSVGNNMIIERDSVDLLLSRKKTSKSDNMNNERTRNHVLNLKEKGTFCSNLLLSFLTFSYQYKISLSMQ